MTPRIKAALLGALVVVLAPALLPTFYVTLAGFIGLATLVALGLVLLTGISGQTSFGQASFVGLVGLRHDAADQTRWPTANCRIGGRSAGRRHHRVAAGPDHRTPVGPLPRTGLRRMGHVVLLVVRHAAPAARLQRHRRHPAAHSRPTLRRQPAHQSRRHPDCSGNRHDDVGEPARQPHRPSHPHAERRAPDGREHGHRHRAPEPPGIRHRRSSTPASPGSCSRISSASSAQRRSASAPASTTCSW